MEEGALSRSVALWRAQRIVILPRQNQVWREQVLRTGAPLERLFRQRDQREAPRLGSQPLARARAPAAHVPPGVRRILATRIASWRVARRLTHAPTRQ